MPHTVEAMIQRLLALRVSVDWQRVASMTADLPVVVPPASEPAHWNIDMAVYKLVSTGVISMPHDRV